VKKQVPYTVNRVVKGCYCDGANCGGGQPNAAGVVCGCPNAASLPGHDCEAPGRVFVEGGVCHRVVPVTTTRMVREQVVQKVPYTRTRNVRETVCQKVPYTVTKMVPETVEKIVPVQVTRMVQETCVKQVPTKVCTMKTEV